MTDLPEGEAMSDELSVVEFDGDEAVAEAIAGIEDSKRTRSGLLRGAGALAGVGAFAALMPRSASARSGGSKANDVKILNYALTLEYLEAAFYAEAQGRVHRDLDQARGHRRAGLPGPDAVHQVQDVFKAAIQPVEPARAERREAEPVA